MFRASALRQTETAVYWSTLKTETNDLPFRDGDCDKTSWNKTSVLFLYDEGPMLETLDYTIRIGMQYTDLTI